MKLNQHWVNKHNTDDQYLIYQLTDVSQLFPPARLNSGETKLRSRERARPVRTRAQLLSGPSTRSVSTPLDPPIKSRAPVSDHLLAPPTASHLQVGSFTFMPFVATWRVVTWRGAVRGVRWGGSGVKRETSAGKQPEQRGRREKSKFISLLQRREGSVEELETPATCLSVHLSVSPVCLYTCLSVSPCYFWMLRCNMFQWIRRVKRRRS